jgi:hypothetical protein
MGGRKDDRHLDVGCRLTCVSIGEEGWYLFKGYYIYTLMDLRPLHSEILGNSSIS